MLAQLPPYSLTARAEAINERPTGSTTNRPKHKRTRCTSLYYATFSSTLPAISLRTSSPVLLGRSPSSWQRLNIPSHPIPTATRTWETANKREWTVRIYAVTHRKYATPNTAVHDRPAAPSPRARSFVKHLRHLRLTSKQATPTSMSLHSAGYQSRRPPHRRYTSQQGRPLF